MERRAPLDCHVVFVTAGSTHRAMGRARDISMTDIYVYTKEPALRGTEIRVEVIFPYQFDTIALSGVVQQVRPGLGMDVRFHPLAEADLRAVADYIDARLRRGSGSRPAPSQESSVSEEAPAKKSSA